VRLVYVDEAGISDRRQEPFLVVASVIVEADKQLVAVERHLDKIVARHIPSQFQDGFIFHASHLFNYGGKVFTKNNPDWPLQKRLALADELAAIPAKFRLPLTMAFAERATAFQSHVGGIADRTDAEKTLALHVTAFIACAVQVEQWVRRNTNGEVCLMIVEDNDNARRFIRQFQNHYQQRDIVKTIDAESRQFFPFRRIKHDPLFEPKKRSNILQLADFWAYVAKRIAMDSEDRRYRRFYDPMHAQYWRGISSTPRPSTPRNLQPERRKARES
jgi:hypothetical protein